MLLQKCCWVYPIRQKAYYIFMLDKGVEELIKKEKGKQKSVINLIASENFVSDDVLKALGSVFINKYAEGYPGERYYGGNKISDKLEKLVQERAVKLFKLSSKNWRVNVQPYSGSPANLAVFHALVPIGEKIMGMQLQMGGHLTHGHKASITGKLWRQIAYGVDKKTETLNYKMILKTAKREKPKLIVAGFTAYSRIIDFKKFRKIADEAQAFLMVDMSHFAGLVAGKAYPSPFPYADIVTTTTHKTLRGPRAAIIFSNLKSRIAKNKNIDIAKKIDKSVFPGMQGGPHLNTIAAIGVALREAGKLEFKFYAQQVIKNAKKLANELSQFGWRIVSGGTDTHQFLLNTISHGINGQKAEQELEKNGIIVNRNTIPYDKRKPFSPSGIRIGTAAISTLGMREKDMIKIAKKIHNILCEIKTTKSNGK